MNYSTASNASNAPAKEIDTNLMLTAIALIRKSESPIVHIALSQQKLDEIIKQQTMIGDHSATKNEFMGIPFSVNSFLPEGVDAIMTKSSGEFVMLTNKKYKGNVPKP